MVIDRPNQVWWTSPTSRSSAASYSMDWATRFWIVSDISTSSPERPPTVLMDIRYPLAGRSMIDLLHEFRGIDLS